jgi:hypothetical protein
MLGRPGLAHLAAQEDCVSKHARPAVLQRHEKAFPGAS